MYCDEWYCLVDDHSGGCNGGHHSCSGNNHDNGGGDGNDRFKIFYDFIN